MHADPLNAVGKRCCPLFIGFRGGSDGKESACYAGSLGGEDPLEEEVGTQLEQAGSLPAASEDGRQKRNVQLEGEGNRCQEGKGLDSLLNAALLQVGSGAGGLRVGLRMRAV